MKDAVVQMWNDAWGFVMSLPVIGDALAWAKAQEVVWLLVAAIVFARFANEWVKSAKVAQWADFGAKVLLLVVVASVALPYFKAGVLYFAPSWGAWGLTIVFAVCHAQIAAYVNMLIAYLTPDAKPKAAAPAPAKH